MLGSKVFPLGMRLLDWLSSAIADFRMQIADFSEELSAKTL
jgi:hypothetical protein